MTNFSIAGASAQAYTEAVGQPGRTVRAPPGARKRTYVLQFSLHMRVAFLAPWSPVVAASAIPAATLCRSIRSAPHHTNTCSGAPHTRRLPSAPCTARATSPVPLCSSSRRSKMPTSSSLRARSTRTVRRCVASRRSGGPERCWHVRNTASHRWSGRRPAAVSSQVVADAGRQAGNKRTPPGLCRSGSPGDRGADWRGAL